MFKKTPTDHLRLELELLPVHDVPRAQVVRPPLPMAPVYPMDKLEAQLDQRPATAQQMSAQSRTPTEPTRVAAQASVPQPVPQASRQSMFFRVKGRGIENDPFLKRLSRLN